MKEIEEISRMDAFFMLSQLISVKLTYGSAHQGLDPQRHSFHKLLRSLDGPLENREAVKHHEGGVSRRRAVQKYEY